MRRIIPFFLTISLLTALTPANSQVFTYQKNNLRFEVEVSNPCNPAASNGAIIFRMLASGSGQVQILMISSSTNSIFPTQTFNTTNSNTFAYSPPSPQNRRYDFIVRDPLNDADVVITFPTSTTPSTGVTLALLTPPVLTATTLTDNTSCLDPNGKLIVDVTGGSRSPALSVPGKFNYTWSSNRPISGLVLQNDFDGSTPLDLSTQLGINGLPGGEYTLKIVDYYSSCFSESKFTLIDSGPAKFDVSGPSSPLCANSNVPITLSNSEGSEVDYELLENGNTIGISATGTNAALTLTIPGSNYTSAGTYTYTIRATSGSCLPATMNGSATVDIPNPVKLNATVTSPTCNGSTTGTIALTGSGGVGGSFQFSIDNGVNFSTGSTFSGLAPGTYEVVVKDSQGCTSVSETITVPDPTPVTVTTTKSDPACTGGTTGSITASASGGTAGYTYSINNGTSFQAGTSFPNLTAGTYSVIAKDSKGCLSTVESVTLSNPAAVAFTTTSTNPLCASATTGTITFTASGGSGIYTYSVNNGTSFASGNPVTGLSAGTYQVVARDDKGCAGLSASVVLTAPSAVTVSASTTAPLCNGSSTGSITVIGGGGTSPYTFSINNGTSYQTSNSFTSLSSGTYSVKVKDNNNCTSSTASITLTAPLPLSHTATATASNCNNTSTGSISITAFGGSGSLGYSIDNGVSFIGVSSFPGLAPGSYQTVAKDINGCFSLPVTVTVSAPAAITFTATPTQPACTGNSNGTIAIVAAGGNGSFSYSINNGSSYVSGSTFSNLAAGVYPVIVKDVKSCISTTTNVTLTDPQTVTFTASPTPVACLGNSNGSISISASGGNSTYTYSINNGTSFSASSTFSNLAAGSYTVVVKDGKNCTAPGSSVTVTAPTAVSATATPTQETCNQTGDGSISVSGTGGNGTYTYSINNGTSFSATSTFSNLVAGSYSVIVKDVKGCLSPSVSVNLAARPVVTFTATGAASTTCVPGNEGKISITGSGGNGTYTYSSDNGSSFQGSSPVTGLVAGSYQVVVKDGNGCLSTAQSITIAPADGITLSGSPTAATCNGNTDGQVTLTAGGGDSNYQYSDDSFTTSQGSNIFTGLATGTYTFTARDGRGCEKSVSATVSEPAVLALNSVQVDVTCNGANDGTFTLSATGGNGGYTFSIDNGTTFLASGSITGLAPNSYQLVVKDSKACVTTAQTATITEPTAVSVASSHTDVTTCTPGTDGTLSATASGGTAGYTYSIDNVTFQAAGSFSTLRAGIYTVYAKDAKGCTTTSTETINSPSGLSLTFNAQDLTCFENQSGEVSISVTGASGAVAYSVDNGITRQSGNTFTALTAGTYNLYIEDNAGCTFVATAIVGQPDIVTTATITGNSPTCNGLADGTLTITGSGGDGNYEYSIDNGTNYQSGGLFSGIAAGNYQVFTRDGNQCLSVVSTKQVTEPAVLTVATVPIAAGCTNDNGAVAVSSVTGGTTPYAFNFNGTPYASLPTNNTFTGLTAGDYTLVITDANNCEASKITAITFPGNIVSSNLPVIPDCFGNGGNGRIDLTISTSGTFQAGISTSANTPPVSFQQVNSTGAGTAAFNDLTNGTYYLTITHSTLCTYKETIVITGGPEPVGFTLSANDPACFEDTGSISVSGITGAASLPYLLEILDGTTVVQTKTITATEASSPITLPITTQGTYLARLGQNQSTISGCSNPIQTNPINFRISGPDGRLDTLSTERTQSYPERGTGSLKAVISETGLEPYESRLELTTPIQNGQSFFSDFSNLDRNSDNEPALAYQELFAGTYKLTIRDGYGCEKDFILQIGADPELFIPNIFTPNDDGVNDSFFVRNLANGSTLVISNRWGKEVYSTVNYANDWTGGNQPDGIYYYRLVTGGKLFTGWLELLRGK